MMNSQERTRLLQLIEEHGHISNLRRVMPDKGDDGPTNKRWYTALYARVLHSSDAELAAFLSKRMRFIDETRTACLDFGIDVSDDRKVLAIIDIMDGYHKGAQSE